MAVRAPLLLAAWSVLVWTTRISNIWNDDDLTTAGQIGRTALALSFTVGAVGVVALWVRARRAGHSPAWTTWVRVFAGWTVAVWTVRATQIALADHEVAFVIVHTVLAAVSIGLAFWSLRAVARSAVEESVAA